MRSFGLGGAQGCLDDIVFQMPSFFIDRVANLRRHVTYGQLHSRAITLLDNKIEPSGKIFGSFRTICA